ncbi:sensor domain-containing diguanylate cyclase [Motilimonas eburnea]|uniref:sensor domain-containing diguanylate cyclase n=1 Tax=Motilimonas eburnea TaxID=1737488 RepID=UPI001E5B4580|nr:diguanylate cyclase [Motilimonas eburnea]MCE2570956.1 diguanylate cyclase [Motilimonas eburnea]
MLIVIKLLRRLGCFLYQLKRCLLGCGLPLALICIFNVSANTLLLDTEKPQLVNIIVADKHEYLGFNQDDLVMGVLTDYWQRWQEHTGIQVNMLPLSQVVETDNRNIYVRLSSELSAPAHVAIPLVGLKVKLFYLPEQQNKVSLALQDKRHSVQLGYLQDKGFLPDNIAQRITFKARPYQSIWSLAFALLTGEVDAITSLSLDTGGGQSDDFLTLFLHSYTLIELDIMAHVAPLQGELIDWISWGANLISSSELQKINLTWLSLSGLWWWLLLPAIVAIAFVLFIWRGVKRLRRKDSYYINDIPFATLILSLDGKYLINANQIAHELGLCGPDSQFKTPTPSWLQPLVNLVNASLTEGMIVNQQLGLQSQTQQWHFFTLNGKVISRGSRQVWLCQLCRLTAQPDFRPLPQQQALLRDVLAAITSPACIKDKQGVMLSCNAPWANLVGLKAEDVIGKRDKDVLSKVELARQRPLESQAWLGQMQQGDDVVVYPMRNEQDQVYALLVVLDQSQVISRAECEQEKQQYLKQSLQNLFVNHPDPVAVVDQGGICLSANPAFAASVVQKTIEQILDQPVADMLPADKVDWNKRQHQDIFAQNEHVKYEELVFLANGQQKWLEVVKSPFRFSSTSVPAILMLTHDITDRKETEQQLATAIGKLEELSFIDGLTQIANRRSFDERLRYYWRSSINQEQSMSMILLDIDYFKPYNDNYGHQQGDDALRLVADTLAKTSKRTTDWVARYGGEEFAILLPDTDAQGALYIAQVICDAVAQRNIPHQHSNVAKHITVSLGVATLTPAPQLECEQLIEQADLALYQAKANGRNQALHYQALLPKQ